MAILLIRIFGPQLAGLAAYAALRFAMPRRDPMLAQLAAVLMTGLMAAYVSMSSLASVPLIGAFVAIELFVALLAQLLIVAAESP